ncbi:SGNH/GDSL hydrolase family protein [Cronobacter malonaticus]|nr:SGNH/GDSL hydrolase family protein [Cronobacter malonaticus]
MTVSTEVDHNDYTGNGVTTAFDYNFRIFKKSDLTVTVVDLNENITTLSLDTDYTVTGAGTYFGGKVNLANPLPNGWKISIERILPVTQDTDLRNQGSFFPEIHEDAFDKLTMLIQQVWSRFGLALRKPSFVATFYDALGNSIRNLKDPTLAKDATTKSYVDNLADSNFKRSLRVPEASVGQLQNVEMRKNKILAFDFNGDPYAVLPESGSAADVMLELAKPTGAGLVGFDDTLSYPAGTVGNYLLQINQIKQQIARRTIPQLERYMGYMAAGKTVKIACYGDSTTDGNGSTGWTANTVNADGSAAGANHNAQAPNAWPARLQTLLRDMYNNTNIVVNNAGYSGQRMDNGWAYNNYDAAITNGAYGKCDIVFIDFGLNDTYSTGSQIDNHVLQTLKLLLKIIDAGSLPVLLTSGPDYRTDTDGGDGWDNKEVSRQINQAKISMGKELNIPVIDKALYLKEWLAKNIDGYAWGAVQPDGLHFGDIGHYYQAGVISMHLFKDIITVPLNGSETVNYMDSRAGALAGRQYTTDITSTKFLKNPLYPDSFLSANLGTQLLEMWVWCDGPDTSCIYRSIDNDGQSNPAVTGTIQVQGSVSAGLMLYNAAPPNAGFNYAALRYADMPMPLCKMQMGLNKVTYTSPSYSLGNGLFHGYFDFVDSWKSGVKYYIQNEHRKNNLLEKTGKIYHFQTAASLANSTVYTALEDDKGTNIVTWGVKNVTTMLALELSIGMGYGLVLMATRGFQGATKYSEAGLVLYRNAGGLLSLRNYGIDASTGALTLSSSLASTSAAYAYSMKELRIDFAKSAAGVTINVYGDWNRSSSALMTLTVTSGSTVTFPRGGVFGGILMNKSEMGTEGGLNVNSAQCIHLTS